MFNQAGKNSVTLATFGGLVTEAPPASLSEGSSPLTWDVDFLIGSVFTRAGLTSVYGAGVNSQNFVWVKSFIRANGTIYTLALAADGTLWQENVTSNPGVLAQIETVTSGDFAFGTTAFDRMYMALTNNDIPRQYDGTNFDRVSQEGPAVAVSPVSTATSNPNLANITSYAIASDVVTFQAVNSFSNGDILQITLPGIPALNGQILSVNSETGTAFTASFSSPDVSATIAAGTATPILNYPITSINQPTAQTIHQQLNWSAGPDLNGSGTNLQVLYSTTQDATLVNAFNSGIPVYVYLSGMPTGYPTGTYQVTGIGRSQFSSNSHSYYFNVTMPSTTFLKTGIGSGYGTYQMTLATVVVSTPVPDAVVGNSVSVQGATPATWNGTWTIVQAPNAGVFQITQTSMDASNNATYNYTLQSGSTPASGDLVTITNTTNGNGIFNIQNGVITSTGTGSFVVAFPGSSGSIAAASETGQAEVSGNTFLIDPGLAFVGSSNATSPIFGNDSSTGVIVTVGLNLNIAAGTRQVVCMFLSRNGYLTKTSPAAVFTVPSNASGIQVTGIPIGPPDTIARWIAFTEAGANGVPGAYFYVIPQPVQTVVGGQTYTYQPTVINDNVTTSATFSFIDSVLLSSTEIDVVGNNQFNMIELGSSQWNINYASRMFWGGEQNKVQNFVNLSFNGGFLSLVTPFPAGWTADATNGAGGSLVVSPAFGNSYYVKNSTGSTQTTYGMITQGATLDSFKVPILQPNTAYSARVSASIPSGLTGGNLVIDLVTFDPLIGYGPVLGSLTIPFSSLSTSLSVNIGTLLTAANVFQTVPANLLLRVYTTSLVNTADVLVDRIEIFPTNTPLLNTQLRASYVNNPEAFDGVTGNLGVAQTNTQPIYGAFVMYDQMYMLKTSSMFSTQDSPGSEPSGWEVQEVSNTVGTCGPNAYDVGEEWAVTACRSGLYAFFGKQPIKLSQEIFQVWDLINWKAAQTIWVRNDIVNRRILVGVPMATPNAFLPNAPVNANPTTPNVILNLNYLGLGDVMALADGEQMHTTMFGTLMSVDMRRKWSIWQIPSPYASFITQQDGLSAPLYLGNGKANGKVYQFNPAALSDDGVAINSLYTTYGWVSAEKMQANPLLGFHRKLWTYMQLLAQGSGNLTIKMLLNNLNPTVPFYTQTLPTITLVANPPDDYERPLNASGNRVFIQFSTNAVGAAFNIQRVILVGSMATLPIRGSAAQ